MFKNLTLSDIVSYALILYEIVISVVAVVITAVDKSKSRRRGARRISESSLLLAAALGGGLCMWLTMIIIRHKTRHPKFMLGLPGIILLHAAAAYLVLCGTSIPLAAQIRGFLHI